MNSWHDVDHQFDKETIECVIEIPMGSKIKYELDKKSGLLRVDRILYSSVHYPCNYGFFPKTFCDDGDALDVLVIGQMPIAPMSLMHVRPIGVFRMRDQGKHDDKVLAIHVDDPEVSDIGSIKNLPNHKLKEIKNFFETYKVLENKTVEMNALEDNEKAIEVIEEAIALYEKTFA